MRSFCITSTLRLRSNTNQFSTRCGGCPLVWLLSHLCLELSEMPSRTNRPGKPTKMEHLVQHYLLAEEEEEEEVEEVEEKTEAEEEVEEVKEVEKAKESSQSRRLNIVPTAT